MVVSLVGFVEFVGVHFDEALFNVAAVAALVEASQELKGVFDHQIEPPDIVALVRLPVEERGRRLCRRVVIKAVERPLRVEIDDGLHVGGAVAPPIAE